MSINITVDGRTIEAEEGQTLLNAALAAGIDIPRLCHDIKLSPGLNCGLCVVSVDGAPPVKACETLAARGMNVVTKDPELDELRRMQLDKLLSVHRGDCIAPCKRACPAHSDCQGYAGLIAEGFFDEALHLIKTSYPLPASLGRICPHPCEDACRRGILDAPVSLAALKRFAGDMELKKDKPYLPELAPSSGKKVAVVGGGPAGLTAAWLLAIAGHKVTVFEAQPRAGGMLRYGIPEFRLPKAVLDQEIAVIGAIGVEIKCGCKVDMKSFEKIKEDYDAVFLGIGAWKAAPLQIPGEELPRVMSGLTLLRKTAVGESVCLGKRVAVVGGGNTAIDSARTAIRLPKVEKVTLLYRRSQDEMPAFAKEVAEAEMEGVELRFLTNPVEIKASGSGLAVRLQAMELSAPDASGRRRPMPVQGKFSDFDCDSLIVAVGQQVADMVPGSPLMNDRGTIGTRENLETSVPGVFAGGDAVNQSNGLAVEAIADGQRAAEVIDKYLKGIQYIPCAQSYAEQKDLTAADFPYAEKKERQIPVSLSGEERAKNFLESAGGLTAEQARAEAARCLECGCLDFYECKLLSYAEEYGMVFPNGSRGSRETTDRRQPYIFRDPNKCIACGLCVRVCRETMGYGCWEMIDSGGRQIVRIAGDGTLPEANCISCGQCVEHCPVGALFERNPRMKSVPLPPEVSHNVCNYCGVGCSVDVHHFGDKPIKTSPVYGGSLRDNVLCSHGRFGWHTAMGDRELNSPLVREYGVLRPAGWDEAYRTALAGLKKVQDRYGRDSVGVLIADRMTNEEIYQSLRLADTLGTKSIYSANIYDGGVEDVFGLDLSTNSYQELADTDCVLVVAADVPSYYAMLALPVQQAKFRCGAKLLVAAAGGWNGFNFIADRRAVMEDDTRFLKEMLKDCIDSGCVPENAAGFEELKASLAGVVPGGEARDFARDYRAVGTAMIMIDRERASAETARLACELAVVCGKIGRPSCGVIQMLQHNNTQTVSLMRIRSNMSRLLEDIKGGKIKGMVLAEQFIPDEEAARLLEYTLLMDSARGPAFACADVFLPMPGYGSFNGTYLSAEGRVQKVNRIFSVPSGRDGWQVLDGLIAAAGGTPLGSLDAVQKSLAGRFPVYRPCLLDGEEFLAGGPVRYRRGYATLDGKAHLFPAAGKAPAFGEMCFADVPLCTWFGQLVGEGVLKID